MVDLDHEVAVVIVGDLREYGLEVNHSEAGLGPEPLLAAISWVADWPTAGCLIKMIRKAILV